MSLAFETHTPAAHWVLRQATAAAHAHLDAKLTAYDLTERISYSELLSRMSGPLSALEAALADGIWPDLFPDFADRQRSPALHEDLADLGGVFCSRAIDPIVDEARAFGALYVLEGSRLGGRVLARQVMASADPGVREATRYFRHREHDGHWRSFVVALNASPAVEARPAHAVEAALQAFRLFDAAF